MMSAESPAAVAELARDRLASVRSASFVSWVTLGEVSLTERDEYATGITDFVGVETQARQRMLASAVIRDGDEKVARSRNPVTKLALGATMKALKHWRADNQREFYYRAGRRWQRTEDGSWRLFVRATPRPGFRDGGDPTMVLEAIQALNMIDEQIDGIAIRGAVTTLLRGRADLSQVEDRLQDFLETGDNRRRWRQEHTPMKLWVDPTGLPRRISYAPLNPNTSEAFWWTLELYDFGTPLERPALPGE